ncbi:MAG: hypothetical protein AB7F86_15740 [Bdellovibrionales bacterium]
MARELNQELLATFRGHAPQPERQEAAGSAPVKSEEVRLLQLHIENLSKRNKEFESKLASMTTKMEEMTAQNKQRFERVQGHFQRQNEILQSGFGDVNAKIAQVVSRVNERRVEDSAVKEMVERHSQVVQSFEIRLQQLQRVISEQELQLASARSELKEAIREIARLKKL